MMGEFTLPLCSLNVCERSQRAFLQTSLASLEWYDKVVNESQVGSVLTSEVLVFDRLETWWLISEGLVQLETDEEVLPAAEEGSLRALLPHPLLRFLRNFIPSSEELFSRFIVYWRLKRNGFVVRSGLKIGADFAVYKGKQGQNHAEYAVVVEHVETLPTVNSEPNNNYDARLSWSDVAAKSRLCGGVNKKLVIMNARGRATVVKRWKV